MSPRKTPAGSAPPVVTVELDPEAPMVALIAHFGHGERELSRRAGVAENGANKARITGEGITLRALKRWIETTGGRLRVQAIYGGEDEGGAT